MKRILFLLSFVIISFAIAQDVIIHPQSIVINPKPSFKVDVFVNKDQSGNNSPSYYLGEEIQIGVRVSKDSYVYLFNVRSNGKIQQILPNYLDPAGRNNFLKAGQKKFFPPRNASYTFNVDGPSGTDKVIAVASKRPLNTKELARFESGAYFATSSVGQDGFAQTLSIVIRPIPQSDWVTDTALFRIR